MVRPELKYLHSPDAPDLQSFTPEDPKVFGLLIQAMIGPEGEIGEESFDFLVCSPAWLAALCAKEGPILGRHYLVLNRFDLQAIERVIHNLCVQARTSTWDEVGEYLGRYGKWEFEDYEPYTGP